jgi:hypothetical protein
MEPKAHLPVLTRRQFFRIGAVGVSGYFLNRWSARNVVADLK